MYTDIYRPTASYTYFIFGLPKKDRFIEKYPVFLFKALGYGFLWVNYRKLRGELWQNYGSKKCKPGFSKITRVFAKKQQKNRFFMFNPKKKVGIGSSRDTCILILYI